MIRMEEQSVSCAYLVGREWLAESSLLLFLTFCSSLHSVGLLVGYLFSSILMAVVGSAVNTTIVCFAESPAEFEANHPQLSAEMRESWCQAWPSEFAG